MAYAQLAGLPAITGLYTSVLCLIGYAALGLRESSCWGRIPPWAR
jgi:Sulfate permease and related transporters (MFS superfamily)